MIPWLGGLLWLLPALEVPMESVARAADNYQPVFRVT
jgi:hypothetical protein